MKHSSMSNRSGRRRTVIVLALAVSVVALGLATATLPDSPHFKAKDPGPRPNPATAIPNPVPGLNESESALFHESLLRVSELEGTCDTCAQQPQAVPPIDPDPNNPFSPLKLVNSAGMGPIFHAAQCFICQSQPALGGSGPPAKPPALIAALPLGHHILRPPPQPQRGLPRNRY